MTFESKKYFITHVEENKVIFNSERGNNIYTIDLSSLTNKGVECLVAIKDDIWMWHRRFGHASMELIEDLSKGDHIIILPKVKFQKDKVYGAFQMGILKKLNQQQGAIENDQVIFLPIE